MRAFFAFHQSPANWRKDNAQERFKVVFFKYLPLPSCRHNGRKFATNRQRQCCPRPVPLPTLRCWLWSPPIRPRVLFGKGFGHLVAQASYRGVIVFLLSSLPSHPIINLCPFFLPKMLSLSFLFYSLAAIR